MSKFVMSIVCDKCIDLFVVVVFFFHFKSTCIECCVFAPMKLQNNDKRLYHLQTE